MKQFAQLEQTHMPYRAPAGDGTVGFFLCARNRLGAWKLRRHRDGVLEEIPTGLPEDWNECCPVADFDGGIATLSFIAGPSGMPGKFGLYKFADLYGGQGIERLCDADVGFARQDWLVHGSRRGPLVVRRGRSEHELHVAGLDFLYRACPDAFDPARLLVTASIRGSDRSIAYDFRSGECHVVTEGGDCLYKFAAHEDGGFVHALRGGGDNEDRRVVVSGPGSASLSPFPGLVRVEPVVRTDSMDCVACFRKHVSAALSFAKEIMGGHGEGADLDHRADLEGEIANAEQHAREMTVPGYAPALRDLRHALEEKQWRPDAGDISVLRRLWRSSMGVSCGCRKHRGEAAR
jgi:hypothetical protein